MTEVRDKSDKKMDKNEEINVKIGRIEDKLNYIGKDVEKMDERLHTIEDRMWTFVVGIVMVLLALLYQIILKVGV